MHVLAVGAGTLENGAQWANAQVLDDELHVFNDGVRLEKGVKVAKINLITDNDNALALRFFKEDFPKDFTLNVETSVKKGAMTVLITDFYPSSVKTA